MQTRKPNERLVSSDAKPRAAGCQPRPERHPKKAHLDAEIHDPELRRRLISATRARRASKARLPHVTPRGPAGPHRPRRRLPAGAPRATSPFGKCNSELLKRTPARVATCQLIAVSATCRLIVVNKNVFEPVDQCRGLCIGRKDFHDRSERPAIRAGVLDYWRRNILELRHRHGRCSDPLRIRGLRLRRTPRPAIRFRCRSNRRGEGFCFRRAPAARSRVLSREMQSIKHLLFRLAAKPDPNCAFPVGYVDCEEIACRRGRVAIPRGCRDPERKTLRCAWFTLKASLCFP